MIEDIRTMQLYIDTMVGIPKFSYPARQNNAPKPTGNFANVRLLEQYPVGIPNQKFFSEDLQAGTTTYRTHHAMRLRFRIGIIEPHSVEAGKIMSRWTSEQMKALMIQTGYGFIKCTPISNEDVKLEKEWEFRNGFAVELYVTRVYEETVDTISSVVITGEYVNDAGTFLPATIDINP